MKVCLISLLRDELNYKLGLIRGLQESIDFPFNQDSKEISEKEQNCIVSELSYNIVVLKDILKEVEEELTKNEEV